MSFNAASPVTWLVALFLIAAGFVAARKTWSRLARTWDDALAAARDRGYHA
jgi:branched-chain amino acid transport system permease protein